MVTDQGSEQWRPFASAVLVADALVEDYFVQVRALSNHEDKDPETFKARVGAANRVYPGIWDHLDQARAMLAEAGRSVPDFDELRARVGNSTHQALIDYDSSEGGDLLVSMATMALSLPTVATFQTNVAGAVLAQRASAMLKRAVPEVDWASAQRLADEPVADLSTGPKFSTDVIIVVVMAVLAIGLVVYWSLH